MDAPYSVSVGTDCCPVQYIVLTICVVLIAVQLCQRQLRRVYRHLSSLLRHLSRRTNARCEQTRLQPQRATAHARGHETWDGSESIEHRSDLPFGIQEDFTGNVNLQALISGSLFNYIARILASNHDATLVLECQPAGDAAGVFPSGRGLFADSAHPIGVLAYH